jgi:ornithine carbamoyltransferase
MKHMLKLLDYSKEEIIDILDLADRLKNERRKGIAHPYLAGKTIGLIFQKSSTRTRVSFETGVYQLGGMGLFLSAKELQISRGESVRDTARVLSRYLDGIVIRTYGQDEVEDLAKYGSIPVINGLTDLYHPCQVLADLMTIREYKKSFGGLKVCYIGDGNNMANSLIVGCLKVEMQMTIVTPKEYAPNQIVMNFAEKQKGFSWTQNIREGAEKADVLITDVWASMGQESEAADRKKAFTGYQINEKVLAVANPGAVVMHCLPAHKGEEITEAVFEAHANEIFDEAENRLHAQKAVMVKLMSQH